MNMGKDLYPPISEVMASMTLSLNAADKKIRVLQERALQDHENAREAIVEIEYLKNRNKQLESEVVAAATTREELQRDYRRAQLDFVKSHDESTDRYLKLVQEHEAAVKFNLALQEALAERDESIKVLHRRTDSQSAAIDDVQKRNAELKLQMTRPEDDSSAVFFKLRGQRDEMMKERDEAREKRDSLKNSLNHAMAKLDRIEATLQGRFVPLADSWCGDEDPRG